MKELVTNQRFPMYPNTDQRVKKNPRLSVKERMRKKMRIMKVMMTMMMKTMIKRMTAKELNQMMKEMILFTQPFSTPPDYELTEEDVNQEDDDTMGEDQEDEENEELYGDLNLNLDRQDAEMTDAQTNQETKEAHMTLTTEPLVVQQQSSSVSSDLVAKFINSSPDTGIDSILNPNVAVSVTPSSDTTIPQPPIPIIQPQQQTDDSTTTTTIPTTTQGVSKTDFDSYVKANDAVMRNMQNQNQVLQTQGQNLQTQLNNLATSNQRLESMLVEREPEVTKDTMPPTNNGSTEDVPPPVVPIVHHESISEPVNAPVSAVKDPNKKAHPISFKKK
ncbi:hypothetical protein Tco_1019544 [Tanacetum coccineum]|uniref:Uncharacterized protein n=1 Tax=Tanacetum coccineum TaxID=301880 RepID=A0ABQ5FXN6_9ASTR